MIRQRQSGWGLRKYSAGVMLLAAVFSLARLAAPAQAATSAPACAWQYNNFTTNSAGYDSNAHYWITPFTNQADLTITVHGVFPTARYFSLTAYNGLATAGTANVIHDTQIAANADGSYTVMVSHAAGANTIQFANMLNGVTGYLVLRVTLPIGNLPLPSLTFTTNADSVPLQPCTTYATLNSSGVFNNPEATYVNMLPPYPMGNTVTVISGKAPTAVRYWSLCSYLWTATLMDCRYDGNIPTTNGYYHVVLGQTGQKNATVAAGYTYLQYGGIVTLRNLLVNQTTGVYAPVVKICAITDRTCIGG